MSQVVTKFECKICGAPFDVNPEDAVFNCVSCGQAFQADGSEFRNHYFLPNVLSQDAIHDIVAKFIKKHGFMRNIQDYSISSIKPRLLPFWVVQTHAFTHFLGYKRYTETRTVGSGKNRRTESVTVYKPVERDINEKRLDVLLGRRATTIFGYDKVKTLIRTEFPKAIPFDNQQLLDDKHEFEYLSTEITEIMANQLAKTIVFDDHRKRAEQACTKVFDCATQLTYEGTFFVHVPVWTVQYIFKNETYRLIINGSNGQVIKGEIPVTPIYRTIFFAVSFLVFLGLGALSFIFGDTQTAVPYILGVVTGLIGFFTLKNSLKEMSIVD